MKKKVISTIFLIIFIIIFLVSGYKIIKYIIDTKENEKVFKKIQKSITTEKTFDENDNEIIKYNVDFATLKATNSDVVGFLIVPGTDIEQIVVKGKDNDYYLTHNFEKNYNSSGWLFADYRNKIDGSDKNIIIYGHNMKNGTMFASLDTVLETEWQNNPENHYITFITEDKESTYEVFSVYQIEAEDYYVKTTFTNNEFSNYINKIKSRSEYNFNVDVTETDNLITLSTCGSTSKYRVVLHAKEIEL